MVTDVDHIIERVSWIASIFSAVAGIIQSQPLLIGAAVAILIILLAYRILSASASPDSKVQRLISILQRDTGLIGWNVEILSREQTTAGGIKLRVRLSSSGITPPQSKDYQLIGDERGQVVQFHCLDDVPVSLPLSARTDENRDHD